MNYGRDHNRNAGQTGHSASVSTNPLLCGSKLNDIQRWMQQVHKETQGNDLSFSGQNTLNVPSSNQSVKANRLLLPPLRRRHSSTSLSSGGAPDDCSNLSGERRNSNSLTEDNTDANILSTSPRLSRPQSHGNTLLGSASSDASLSCHASEYEAVISLPSPGNSARSSRSASPLHGFQSHRHPSPSRLPPVKPEFFMQRTPSPLPGDAPPDKQFANVLKMNERNRSRFQGVQTGSRQIRLCSSSADNSIPSIILTPDV